MSFGCEPRRLGIHATVLQVLADGRAVYAKQLAQLEHRRARLVLGYEPIESRLPAADERCARLTRRCWPRATWHEGLPALRQVQESLDLPTGVFKGPDRVHCVYVSRHRQQFEPKGTRAARALSGMSASHERPYVLGPTAVQDKALSVITRSMRGDRPTSDRSANAGSRRGRRGLHDRAGWFRRSVAFVLPRGGEVEEFGQRLTSSEENVSVAEHDTVASWPVRLPTPWRS